jgi:hypothetical protein
MNIKSVEQESNMLWYFYSSIQIHRVGDWKQLLRMSLNKKYTWNDDRFKATYLVCGIEVINS